MTLKLLKTEKIGHSLFPERFLSEEISHPDEVKQLAIYLSFDNYEGSSCGCKRNRYVKTVLIGKINITIHYAQS
jgi:hypothetical protein